jgi:hypothetical protein
MSGFTLERLNAFRAETFRSQPGSRVKTRDQAIDFVNQRGFVFFWPITGITLPSLWAAVAGNRPVANEHDDPGHVTWGWKDSLLGKDAWYYAKVLRKRSTIIAMDVAPYFYALSENYGSPEEDHLTLYEQGRLTLEAKNLYDALLKEGSLDTIALRQVTHMTSQDSDARFNKALTDLQADFKILPVGVSQAGRWHYAFYYQIVARQYPDLPERSRMIGERSARRSILGYYFRSVGIAQIRDVVKLFGWNVADVQRALDELIGEGHIAAGVQFQGLQGEWYALCDLERD